jgi:hypothetical protein
VKPIDVLTGLPRSPDIARVVAAQGKQGELQAQSQVSIFAREMKERQSTVNEAPKVEGSKVDAENGGEGGTAFYDAQSKKKGKEEGKESAAGSHPSKGKILDIRGA